MSNVSLVLLDNLAKGVHTPSGRAIKQGRDIKVMVAGTEKGLLVAAIYKNKFPQVVRYDGLPGTFTDGKPDQKDGFVEVPTSHPQLNGGVPLPLGQYTLHVEAEVNYGDMVPHFWNVQFDIVA
jgi:hypothetical protein